ncbi:hypothetical protein CASFOL_035996 [Castilleja foliolosa]|uniref:QWRF motif-containing protein 2 n=1 Tax=Castilleja foliolosa TaxID=1961234 RepID=A0ABD3BVG1_9LAMI
MMVATVSGDEHSTRPPLLPSEKDYSSNGISNTQKKPKSKIVSSRYMSPSTSTSNSTSISSSSSSSRRYPSPSVSTKSNPASYTPSLSSKRSVSVDRRRSSAVRPLTGNGADISAATKLLITSTRSLSVSFQGESFSLPVSKTKIAPSSPNPSSARKGTPERRRNFTPSRGKPESLVNQPENPKFADQHCWPARNRTVSKPLSRSLDCKLIGSINGSRSLQQSMIDERRISIDLGNSKILKTVHRGPDGNSVSNDITTSDSDSVSSGSTSGVHVRNEPSRGIAVSARFWQETNSRLRRLQDPGSPLSTSPGSKLIGLPKLKRTTSNGSSLLSSPRTISSPRKSIGSSPSRGQSPSHVRNAVSTISSNFSKMPSVLSFAVDVRRGKVGENRMMDAHFLRLLYNRHLQWRFVNARTEMVLLAQQRSVKKHLWNAWITISDLRDIVTKKRHRLQLLRQKLKLATILKLQMSFLEEWALLDKEHSVSLLGAIEALTASTLRLPIVGAIGDVQSLQDVICSAFDIMQTMTPSLHLLLPLVEKVNSLVSELAKVTAKEEALIEQCTNVISSLAAMQVKDSSLRTHIIQRNHL